MTTAQVDRFNGLTGARGVKDPCRAVSTGNLTLSGEQTVNGVACVADDRVLVKDQTDPIENGIYDVKTTAWVRSADFNGTKDIAVGTTVVAQGNYYSVVAAGTIGSGAITFTPGVAGGGAADIHAATAKSPLVGADEFGFWDSVSGLLRKISYTNLLSSLGSTFAALAGVSTQVFSVAEAAAATNAPRASQLTGRNMIINGSCQIDQVHEGQLNTPASLSYPIDNVFFAASQPSKLQSQQVTNKLNSLGATHALRMTVLASYVAGAGEYFVNYYPIEGINFAHLQWGTANAATVSLQFKARASVAGTYSGALMNASGTRSYPFSFALAANTDTLVKIENIPGDTAGVWPKTQTTGAYIVVNLGSSSSSLGPANAWAGANYIGVTGTASFVGQANGSELTIGDMQLEKGPYCTQFERKSISQDSLDCQRYLPVYEFGSNGIGPFGQVVGAASTIFMVPFQTRPRIEPTGMSIVFGDGQFYVTNATGTPVASANPTFVAANMSGARVNATGSGLTAGNATELLNFSVAGKIIFTGAQI